MLKLFHRRVLLTIGLVLLVALLTAIFHLLNTLPQKPTKGERYDELEFIVIHRPHITYFVDLKYLTCFATRKPNYQDLVNFICPDDLLNDAKNPQKKTTSKKK